MSKHGGGNQLGSNIKIRKISGGNLAHIANFVLNMPQRIQMFSLVFFSILIVKYI